MRARECGRGEEGREVNHGKDAIYTYIYIFSTDKAISTSTATAALSLL